MSDPHQSAILTTPSASLSSVSSSANLSPTTVVCLTSCAKSNGRVTVKIGENRRAEIDEEYNHLDNDRSPTGECLRVSSGAVTIWKILALYFVIILLFGFVYSYTVPSYVTEKFNITIIEEQVNQVLLSISYHRSEEVVVVRSVRPADSTETLFDLGQDLVAHRDLKNEKCYVRSAVSFQFGKEYELVKEIIKMHLMLWKRPSEMIPMLVLKRKVHAEVLRNVAGENIADFCGNFKTRWLVSYEDENTLDQQSASPKVSSRETIASIDSSFYRIILHQKS